MLRRVKCLVMLLVPAVAGADVYDEAEKREPRRMFELTPLFGAMFANPSTDWIYDHEYLDESKSMLVGASLAWERNPRTVPFVRPRGFRSFMKGGHFYLAPELQLFHAQDNVFALAGLRLEYTIAWDGMGDDHWSWRQFFVPHVGTQGSGLVVGGEYVSVLPTYGRLGIVAAIGINGIYDNAWESHLVVRLGAMILL